MSHDFRITTANDGTRRFQRGGVSKGRRWNNRGPKSFNNRGPVNPESIRKLLDSDVNMDGDSINRPISNNHMNSRNNGRRGRGRNFMIGGGVSAFKRLGLPINGSNVSPTKHDWYIISILHARDLDKSFILQSLTSKTSTPFEPICFSKDDNTAYFYVKTQQEAWAIRSLNKLITTPSGYKMVVLIRKSDAPTTRINDEVIECIKSVMSKRYISESASLNLSEFAKDPELIGNDISIGMNRSSVINTILDIIANNIPMLKALDLSNNSLNTSDLLVKLYEKAPNIQKISLANNQLRQDRDIYNISKLPISELILDGNPLRDRYKDKQDYISFVRKCFPKVIKLDDQILPPPITFDVEAASLPNSKGSYFENPGVQDQICIFLQQYFNFYDSDSRNNLMGAYHEKAVFSLTANYSKFSANRQAYLGEYFAHARNNREGKSNNNIKVMVGRDSIISLLSKLPSSQHDMKSLLVDTKFISPSMLLISINGVFKERKSTHNMPPVRTFSKVLITVPNGAGIAIVNEMLNISCLPNDQHKNYFTDQNDSASSSIDLKSSNNVNHSMGVIDSTPKTEIMLTMVKQLSAITRMNENYSQMCLAENNWDYQLALEKFSALQQTNSIPPQAFQ